MMKQIAVIGSGVMGHGIAQVYALAGFDVAMYDIEHNFLEKAMGFVEKNLLLLVQEGVLTETNMQETLQKFKLTTDLEQAVQDADFIVEAIPEVLELKWELFEKLERYAKPTAIIASNTSTFPISRLVEKMTTADRMIITHFFNPAQLVPLVEIVKHEKTSPDVVNVTLELMQLIGKSPVLLKKDVPGFIANRLQAALVREAFFLLEQGVADARDIDRAVTAGPGFRWAFTGPIEIADFGGLDTWQRVVENLAPELDKSEKSPLLIQERVKQGKLGTKSGEGIYSYADTSIAEEILKRDEQYIRLAKIKKS
jgi:3-hydroxybutyryl-CoA dehydrogenase